MHTQSAITPLDLQQRLRESPLPMVGDLRRVAAFERLPEVIAGAILRAPEDFAGRVGDRGRQRPVVGYRVHGQGVSQKSMAALRSAGFDAAHLVGGIHARHEPHGAGAPNAPPSRWVTRARPKFDRIARPWRIRRFIDPSAACFRAPVAGVAAFAVANGASPCGVRDVTCTHQRPQCGFDAFLRRHALRDPELADLAVIVRAADAGPLPQAAQTPGPRTGRLVDDEFDAWRREARVQTQRAERTPVQRAMKA